MEKMKKKWEKKKRIRKKDGQVAEKIVRNWEERKKEKRKRR